MEADGVAPQALLDKPEVDSPHLFEITSAFWTINCGRSEDGLGGLRRISLDDIRQYIDLFGRPTMDLDLFVRHVFRQDELYRSLKAAKSA